MTSNPAPTAASADLLVKIRRAADFGIEVGDVRVDFGRMMERKEEVVLRMRGGVEAACKRKQVRVVKEHGVIEDSAVSVAGERIEYDKLIVCVGTEPYGLPGVDMEHPSAPRPWTPLGRGPCSVGAGIRGIFGHEPRIQ